MYSNDDDTVIYDGPMAVMVNRLSASASEIFAGAMQDYGRALVLGGQTFGKGTVQTMIPLNRGQLKLTAAKFYRVSGQSTQNQGVIPDIAFPSLFDQDAIGESSLDGAMPWDVIDAARYHPFSELSPYIFDLQTSHIERTKNDPHFIYYRALMEKAEERSGRTQLSLNETLRREEKEQDDSWRLQLENTLRAATGKPIAASLAELEELEEAEAEALENDDKDSQLTGAHDTTAAASGSAEKTLDLADADSTPLDANTEESESASSEPESYVIEEIGEDPMLREAGRIVTDLIKLTNGSPIKTPLTAEATFGPLDAPLSR